MFAVSNRRAAKPRKNMREKSVFFVALRPGGRFGSRKGAKTAKIAPARRPLYGSYGLRVLKREYAVEATELTQSKVNG